ncbi:hypothetical protein D3C79_661880 [compost metagenome]
MDGVQQRLFERFVDHLTQLMHMAAQAVAVGAVVAPQGFFQYLATQHMRAFLHQHGEQLEADRVELEQTALAGHLQGVEVVVEVGDLQRTAPSPLGTAQHRFDARGQLGQGERLEQVVVGAGTEALQAVVQLVAGGEHDHRGVTPRVLAQALAQGVAIDAG